MLSDLQEFGEHRTILRCAGVAGASADERGQVVAADLRRPTVALRQIRRRAGDLQRRPHTLACSRSTRSGSRGSLHRSSRCVATTSPAAGPPSRTLATPPRPPGGRSSLPRRRLIDAVVLERRVLLEVCPLERVIRSALPGDLEDACEMSSPRICPANLGAKRSADESGAAARRRAPTPPRAAGPDDGLRDDRGQPVGPRGQVVVVALRPRVVNRSAHRSNADRRARVQPVGRPGDQRPAPSLASCPTLRAPGISARQGPWEFPATRRRPVSPRPSCSRSTPTAPSSTRPSPRSTARAAGSRWRGRRSIPIGGGQPSDTGTLQTPAGTLTVTGVRRERGTIWHTVPEGDLPDVGAEVQGAIDWDRRHRLMRTHTALHILCGVIWADYSIPVTGGNMEPMKGRLDFPFPAMSADLGSAGRAADQRGDREGARDRRRLPAAQRRRHRPGPDPDLAPT